MPRRLLRFTVLVRSSDCGSANVVENAAVCLWREVKAITDIVAHGNRIPNTSRFAFESTSFVKKDALCICSFGGDFYACCEILCTVRDFFTAEKTARVDAVSLAPSIVVFAFRFTQR